MKHDRIIYTSSIVGLVALIAMLFFTSPTEIGPFGVLLFFTTVYIVCFGLVVFLMQTFLKIALKKTNFKNKDYLYAAILAFGPIMLLMARSFGAISIWTIGLIALFLILAEFLAVKRA